ncbi:hypothetical protein BaRGS_00027986, partial [Batillaria attramentaria]
ATRAKSSKSAKVRRRNMTSTKTDREIIELMGERLEKGFEGMRQMFRANDPRGGETITKEALLKILYNVLGYIHTDQYQRFLRNIGLSHKDGITFDMFVSRFKECEKMPQQWTNPVKREYNADIASRAHPEEELRDCEVFEWGQLKTAPHAFYCLERALREKKADIRAILPEQCFMDNGVVDRPTMRHALSELGVYLTDVEFGDFWDRFDEKRVGVLPIKKLYSTLNLDENGEPLASPPPQPLNRPPPMVAAPYRDPNKSYQKFVEKRHTSPHAVAKAKYDPRLSEGICGTPLGRSKGPFATPKSECSEVGDDTEREMAEEMEKQEKPEVEAEARAKIRSVMKQGGQKFENIMDSLNYKFEGRYHNMCQAFKLFDISEDGYVMRIDFRRVLAEFGFPLTALELGHFVSSIGQSITHGQIQYRNLMNKLLNRTDGFVSRVLDSKIMQLQKGGTDQGLGEGDNVIEVACRLVEYLHTDYIKLAGTLLRLDKNDKAVVSPAEFKQAVENCLGEKLTSVQWTDLQDLCKKDDQGNIRYIDFLQSFDKEPGAWNLVTHGQVTVPKQPVSHPTCAEVENLERTKHDALPKMPEKKDERKPEELREELKKFFTDHLFDFDEQYHLLDRKASNNFSRWQFGALLKLCGFPITEKELEKLWMTMKTTDNNMSSYNAVVMEFAPGHEAFHLPDKKPDSDEEGEDGTRRAVQGDEGDGEVTVSEDPRQLAGIKSPPFEQRTGNTPLDPHTRLQEIMKKLQPAVTANWERLKTGFRNLDPNGFGSVTYRQMQLLIDSCKSGLTRDERNQICSQFDFRSNGRCNYLSFMKAFALPKPPVSKFVYAPHTHKLERRPVSEPEPITVSDAMLRVRRKLIKHHKNLRRAFQKADKSRSGYLGIPEFKAIFKECSLPLSEEDFYHILTEFDANMQGRLCYAEFLDALLRM